MTAPIPIRDNLTEALGLTEACAYVVAKAHGNTLTTWREELHTEWGGACIGLAEAQGAAEAENSDPDAWDIYALFPIDDVGQPYTH